MAKTNTRLELTWIGKENRPKLEPRVLVEDAAKSYHAAHRVSENDMFDNRLIFGDNLLALTALEQEFTGKIKCIYIDPPYNTGSAFRQYDDGIEHSLWLGLLAPRLESLQRLLTVDGSIFVQIDDNECHYLKVLMDEVLGRRNFVTSFVWQKVDSPNDNKVPITPDHEYLLCYAKDADKVRFHQKGDASLLEAYRGPDELGRMYRDRLLKKNGKNSLRQDRPSMFFAISAPNGQGVYPIHDDGREACWALGKTSVERLIAAGELIWKNRGTEATPRWVPYTREYAPESDHDNRGGLGQDNRGSGVGVLQFTYSGLFSVCCSCLVSICGTRSRGWGGRAYGRGGSWRRSPIALLPPPKDEAGRRNCGIGGSSNGRTVR